MSKETNEPPNIRKVPCKSCLGVLVYFDIMKKKGQEPFCFGITGKPKITDDNTPQNNNRPSASSKTKDSATEQQLFTGSGSQKKTNDYESRSAGFFILGYSQFQCLSTNNEYKLIIRKCSGICVNFKRTEMPPHPLSKIQNKNKVKEEGNDDGDMLDDDLLSPTTPALQFAEMADSAFDYQKRFQELLSKGMNIQINNMVNFSNHTYIFAKQFSVNLPQKLMKSSSLILKSMRKTCERITKGMSIIVNKVISPSGKS